MTEKEERELIVKEAMTWVGTPYHEHGRKKGVGVDCGTFLAEVFIHAGLIEKIDIPYYSPQWHLHRSRELYVETLLQYTKEIFRTPLPGDIAVWKIGRTHSHGALVTQWPTVIQSVKGKPICEAHAERDAIFREGRTPRSVRFFSYWGG